MIELKLEIPKSQEIKILRLLDPQKMLQVEADAVNRTTANVQKETVRMVAEYMGITQAKLAKRGRRVFSSSSDKHGTVSRGPGANRRRLYARVYAIGRPFNAVRWGGKEVEVPGRARATTHSAWGRQVVAPNTWQLVNMPGRPLVVRQGKSFRGVYGPGVARVLVQGKMMPTLRRFAQARFDLHFASRFKYRFG